MFNKVINTLVSIFNEGAYTNIIVSNTINTSNFNDSDKKLYTKLVYGVVENKLLIDYHLQPLIKGQRVKPFIKNALRVGVYGFDNLNLAKHYLVDSIVSAVKKKDYKASTFVNAILRKYQNTAIRTLDNLPKLDYLSIKYSLDKDLTNLLYKQYKNKLEEFFSNSEESINTYRINTIKTNKEYIENYLKENSIAYNITSDVILQTKQSLINTNIFKDGLIVAQDKSSIMTSIIANPKENDLILDCCSAPGSKSMHMASIINNKGTIISLDVHEHKIKLIEDNANKLGVTCVKAYQKDATTVSFDEKFDVILADVPCSGLGVIRHKPDLKYQMKLEKIENIKTLQKSIVNNVIKYLKDGGSFIYSTCTINKDENELFIKEFVKNNPKFKIEEEIITLPSSNEDGFYICKLRG